MILAVLAPSEEDQQPRLRPARRPLPLYPPSDLRGRWSRTDQGYRGGSVIVARLLAWIDAVAAHSSWDEVLAAMESADRREQARLEGWNTEAARWLAEKASPELREAFESEVPLERVLGWWDVEYGWHEGLAGLTYMECMATTLSLNGDQPWEVARSERMLSRRRRRAGETVPVENVYKYLSTSAAKLAGLFGTAGESIDPGDRPTSRPMEPRKVTEHRWGQRAWPAPWEEVTPEAELGVSDEPEDEENPPSDSMLD